MSMNLFVVRNQSNGEVLGSFSSKVDAKKLRKEKNKVVDGVEQLAFVVSPGKDHPDFGKKTHVTYRGKTKVKHVKLV